MVRADVRVGAVRGEVLLVECPPPAVADLGPIAAAVIGVVAVKRLSAHHVADGERPAGFAGEETQATALEVAPHRLGERMVVVLEGAAVLPHECQRARLVEAEVAGSSLEGVDHVAEEGREHDVVAADRIGVGVEVAQQVQGAPVAPHPQIGVLLDHLGESLADTTRRVR